MIKRKLLLPALIGASLLTGCGEQAAQKKPMMMPIVATQAATTIQYQPEQSFVGRTEAVEDVGIIPQVSGYLKSRYFKEGEMVNAGQLLYQIDPSLYDAKVSSANASVAQAKAGVTNANLDYARGQDLLPRGGISQSEFDRLTAVKLQAEAALKSAEAQLQAAKTDLSHTIIRAPFAGRISESRASIGDLVSPSSGVLTTIVSLDPMQASFSMSEKERLSSGADRVSGRGKAISGDVEVWLKLGKGFDYEYAGQLDYLGNRIDTQTGTIALRAKFPNPEHRLLPGQYVDVIVKDKNAQPTLVIPRLSVQTDLEGDYVMVLKDGNVVERRNVELGTQTMQGVIVKAGLTEGEQVLTKGLQRVRNGMTVRLEEQGAQS